MRDGSEYGNPNAKYYIYNEKVNYQTGEFSRIWKGNIPEKYFDTFRCKEPIYNNMIVYKEIVYFCIDNEIFIYNNKNGELLNIIQLQGKNYICKIDEYKNNIYILSYGLLFINADILSKKSDNYIFTCYGRESNEVIGYSTF